MHIVFETPRLILSQFTEDDAPLILALNSDPEIVKYVLEPTLKSEEEAKKYFTQQYPASIQKQPWPLGHVYKRYP